MRKIYSGTCDACGRESRYLERDHRVPPRLGGSRNVQRNVHDLCLECHKRKSFLEVSLMDLYAETADVREWFLLAFGDDTKAMSLFAGEIRLRATHFGEVIAELTQSKSSLRLRNIKE